MGDGTLPLRFRPGTAQEPRKGPCGSPRGRLPSPGRAQKLAAGANKPVRRPPASRSPGPQGDEHIMWGCVRSGGGGGAQDTLKKGKPARPPPLASLEPRETGTLAATVARVRRQTFTLKLSTLGTKGTERRRQGSKGTCSPDRAWRAGAQGTRYLSSAQRPAAPGWPRAPRAPRGATSLHGPGPAG